jgi:hypothetical protein
MKTIINISVVIFLFAIAPRPCFASMEIEQVTKERAKELGMEIVVKGAGPDLVRVELTFPTGRDLKDYVRVDLFIGEGDKSVLFVSLKEEQTKPGQVMVSFAADRAHLEKITLRLVTGVPRNLVGHDLRVKDFVELGKAR